MRRVTNFRELEVYQLCRQLSKEVFEISKSFPREETYSLIDRYLTVGKMLTSMIDKAAWFCSPRR